MYFIIITNTIIITKHFTCLASGALVHLFTFERSARTNTCYLLPGLLPLPCPCSLSSSCLSFCISPRVNKISHQRTKLSSRVNAISRLETDEIIFSQFSVSVSFPFPVHSETPLVQEAAHSLTHSLAGL